MECAAGADDADLVCAIFNKLARPFSQLGGGTDKNFGHTGSPDQ
jgi:hypothetical protein